MTTTNAAQDRDAAWKANFEKAIEFHAEHGRFPSRTTTPTDRRFGIWAANQRVAGAQLTPERQAMLEQAIPDWRGVPRESVWDDKLASLITWVEANSWPDGTSSDPVENSHGIWLRVQRSSYRDSRLSADRAAKLDALLPSWNGQPRRALNWMQSLTATAKVTTRNGQIPRQSDDDPETKVLAKWVSRQRANWRRGVLNADRQEALNRLLPNWSWTDRKNR
jgi:hypothetical protein